MPITIRVPSGQSIFDFKLKIQNQNFCAVQLIYFQIQIENHPFFFSDFRFFSFLFVAENVILKLTFFRKFYIIFNFTFFHFSSNDGRTIENRKMKIFELLILIKKVKFRIDSLLGFHLLS